MQREEYSIVRQYAEPIVQKFDGYYYNNDNKVHLFIRRKNRNENLFQVNLSGRGEIWKGSGVLEGDTLVANNGDTSVTVTRVDKGIVEISSNSTFTLAIGFYAKYYQSEE